MIILANLLQGIALVLDTILNLALILIIARAVISWVNPDPFNPIVRFLTSTTDPILTPLRKYIPPMGGIDLSPIIVCLGIYFLRVVLVSSLLDYSHIMKV